MQKRQRNVQKSVMHVRSCCFAIKPDVFYTFSLPSRRWILKSQGQRKEVFTWENSHWREFHTGMTSWFRIGFTWWLGHFISRLYENSLNVDQIHVRVNYAYAITPKRVVVSRLHDTVAKFRIGVKFSLWYNNRGELTPVWLAPAY